MEGFVGGAIATILFGFFASRVVTTLEWADTRYLMACPVVDGMGWSVHRCDVDTAAGGLYKLWPLADFAVGRALPSFLRDGILISEIQLHAVALAIFASVVAPFGGFFASGFKRAFKIKDFGTSIPGHGGFTDRMDCQLVMGAFSFMYGHYILRLGQTMSADAVSHYLGLITERLSTSDLQALHSALGKYLVEAATAGAGVSAATAAAGAGLGGV